VRVGVDGRKFPRADEIGPHGVLDGARALGLEGVFFRTVLDMSPTLDHGALREVRAHADALGLYLEAGLGKVNPYATPEAPELRAAGDGDIRLGFERMLRACRAMGVTDAWVGTASFKPAYRGYWCYDRFRTDASWEEQLAATERFLRKLAPVARDLGVHMNVETHEEITTHEVVRLVEAVGPDVMGVTLDAANVVHRGEDPVAAARRVAPYVRQTHMKDAFLATCSDGLLRQVRACGRGIVDHDAILPLLHRQNPSLTLSIESPTAHGHALIQVRDPVWRAAHPDLAEDELAELDRLARRCAERAAAGEWPSLEAYEARPFDRAAHERFIVESAAALRAICARHGLGAAA
jgi:sugar phosphate isomerase/epimerase